MTGQSERQTIFDFARLGLAGLVIASHSFDMLGTKNGLGDLAVDGFFILSGYLITRAWISRPDILHYASRRFLRIVPGFVVAFLVSVFLIGPFGVADPVAWLARLPASLLADLATLNAPVTTATFRGLSIPQVNVPMWTIHWEVLCYALAPLGVIALRRRPWLAVGFALLLIGLWAAVPASAARLLLMFLAGAMVSGQALPSWTPKPPKIPDMSYGTYLYGWPVGKLVASAGVHDPWPLFAVTLPLAVLCGWASFVLVERPMMGLRLIRPASGRWSGSFRKRPAALGTTAPSP